MRKVIGAILILSWSAARVYGFGNSFRRIGRRTTPPSQQSTLWKRRGKVSYPYLHQNHEPKDSNISPTQLQLGNPVMAMAHRGWFAGGKLWPVISKLLVGPEKAKRVAAKIIEATLWQDIVILLILAFAMPTLPLGRYLTKLVTGKKQHDVPKPDSIVGKSVEEEESTLWGVLRQNDLVQSTIRNFARVSLLAYLVDVTCIALDAMGFQNHMLEGFPVVFAKTAFSLWALRGFLVLKRLALCEVYNVKPNRMGRYEVVDRLVSGFTTAVALLLLGDWLSVKMGLALKGIVTIGSAGTLALTFATKDLASQFVGGLALSATNKVGVGEDVDFGDGESGSVIKIGFMETLIRQPDDRLTVYPNSILARRKVSNLSRVKISQVAQTLRFHYNDVDKIPSIVKSIRAEIKTSCPDLITNGYRPFRVHWTNFCKDHLEVRVNSHYYIPPTTDAYWNNRQNVLMAINRAVRENNVDFATIEFLESDEDGDGWRLIKTAKSE